jgi:hypothetical protein
MMETLLMMMAVLRIARWSRVGPVLEEIQHPEMFAAMVVIIKLARPA